VAVLPPLFAFESTLKRFAVTDGSVFLPRFVSEGQRFFFGDGHCRCLDYPPHLAAPCFFLGSSSPSRRWFFVFPYGPPSVGALGWALFFAPPPPVGFHFETTMCGRATQEKFRLVPCPGITSPKSPGSFHLIVPAQWEGTPGFAFFSVRSLPSLFLVSPPPLLRLSHTFCTFLIPSSVLFFQLRVL